MFAISFALRLCFPHLSFQSLSYYSNAFFPNKYFTLLMSYCLLMDLNGHRWYLKSPKKADVKIESPHTCQGRLHPKWHMLYGLSLSLEQGGSPFPKYFTDGYLGKYPWWRELTLLMQCLRYLKGTRQQCIKVRCKWLLLSCVDVPSGGVILS